MLWEAIMRYDYDDDDVGEAYKIIGKMQFCISLLSLYIYYCEGWEKWCFIFGALYTFKFIQLWDMEKMKKKINE